MTSLRTANAKRRLAQTRPCKGAAEMSADVIYGPIPFNDGDFTFLLRSEALATLELWDALLESSTWKEFWERGGEPVRSWFGYDEFTAMTEEEAEEAGVTRFPVDETPFERDAVEAVHDYEWPPLAHMDGWQWIPRDLRWRFGISTGGFTAGVWVVFAPTEVKPVADELRERGYMVEPDFDLVAWSCGGEQEHVRSDLRGSRQRRSRTEIAPSPEESESQRLKPQKGADTGRLLLSSELEAAAMSGFDWSIEWDGRTHSDHTDFSVNLFLDDTTAICQSGVDLALVLHQVLKTAYAQGATTARVHQETRSPVDEPEAVTRLLDLDREAQKLVQPAAESSSVTWSQYVSSLLQYSKALGWWVYISRSARRPDPQEYACYVRDATGRHGTGWGNSVGGACVEGLVAMLQPEPQEIPQGGIY